MWFIKLTIEIAFQIVTKTFGLQFVSYLPHMMCDVKITAIRNNYSKVVTILMHYMIEETSHVYINLYMFVLHL